MLPRLRLHGSILVSWGVVLLCRGGGHGDQWSSPAWQSADKKGLLWLRQAGQPTHTWIARNIIRRLIVLQSHSATWLCVCACVWGYDTHPHQRGLNVKSQRVKAYLSQSGRYTQPPTQAAIHLHVQTKQTLNHQRTHAQAHNHPHTHTDTNAAGNLGAGLL